MNTETLPAPAPPSWRPIIQRGAVVVALGVLMFLLCLITPEANAPSEAGVIMRLPSVMGDFAGSAVEVSAEEKKILPPDTQFARTVYHDFANDEVNCEIVLSGGEKRSIHRPEICLPAQGWNKRGGEVITVKLKDGRTLQVMKLTISKLVETKPGERKDLTALFIYWFIGKGMTTPNHWYRILHTDWDRVTKGINHRWAYVIVSAPVLEGFMPNGKNEAETQAMLEKFIAQLAPEILKPDTDAALPSASPPPAAAL